MFCDYQKEVICYFLIHIYGRYHQFLARTVDFYIPLQYRLHERRYMISLMR